MTILAKYDIELMRHKNKMWRRCLEIIPNIGFGDRQTFRKVAPQGLVVMHCGIDCGELSRWDLWVGIMAFCGGNLYLLNPLWSHQHVWWEKYRHHTCVSVTNMDKSEAVIQGELAPCTELCHRCGWNKNREKILVVYFLFLTVILVWIT